MCKRILLIILIGLPFITQSQDNYYITFSSDDGVSNVVGASVYPGKFVQKPEKQTAAYLAYLETSLSTARDANLLQRDVMRPLLGNPSEGHAIYMKFKILSNTDNKLKIELISKKEAFSKKATEDGHFYVLIRAKTIEEANKKIIFETFDDITPD